MNENDDTGGNYNDDNSGGTGGDIHGVDGGRHGGDGSPVSRRVPLWRRSARPAGPAGTSPCATAAGRSRPTPVSARTSRSTRTTGRITDRAASAGPGDATGAGPGSEPRTAGPVPYWSGGDGAVALWTGDAVQTLRGLPADHVDSVVTSPPYWALRDYGTDGQYGLEATPDAYVERLRGVFREVARVMRPTGTVWLNLGDSYAAGPPGRTADPMRRSTLGATSSAAARREMVRAAGAKVDRTRFLPRKSLMGMPWRVAMALQADGWILRNAIVWHKPSPMPNPVGDRFTCAHEFVFLLVRQGSYHFDLDAVREPRARQARRSTSPPRAGRGGPPGGWRGGRNPGDVWTVPSSPFRGAHFATMPPALAVRCVAAGSPVGGVVLDPFSGAGTTGVAALTLGRRYVGIELNDEYNALAKERLLAVQQTTRPDDSSTSPSGGSDGSGSGGSGGPCDRERS